MGSTSIVLTVEFGLELLQRESDLNYYGVYA